MHKFRGIKTSTPARAVALWAARSSWGRLESLQIHQMLPLWFFWTLLPNFFFLFFCSPCRHLRPCLFTITVSDSCHGNRHKQDPNKTEQRCPSVWLPPLFSLQQQRRPLSQEKKSSSRGHRHEGSRWKHAEDVWHWGVSQFSSVHEDGC